MRRRSTALAVLAIGAVGVVTAGCGGDSSPSSGAATKASSGTERTVTLGTDKKFKVGGGKLKIALMYVGSTNTYLQAQIKAAKETAAKGGAEVTVYDSNFDSSKQINQLATALTQAKSGKFNAFVLASVDPATTCNFVRNQIGQAGIPTSISNQAICGRATKPIADSWEPGTVNYVGGMQSSDAFYRWLERIVKDNPGPQKVGMLTGPDLNANTQNVDIAIDKIQKAHPEFKIVTKVRTDYTIVQGQSKTEAILRGNPDLTILASNYSDPTRGAVQAIKAAGKSGQVKVYDYGGSSWIIDAIKRGEVQLTGALLPYTEMARAVESLVDLWAGKDQSHVIDLSQDKAIGDTLIDKTNAASFKPEY
jgi:ribose transport system substrate-binding protein